MLKRLIFAVFVLGLFFTLNGTAISDSALRDWSEPLPTVPHFEGELPPCLQQAQTLYKEFDPVEHLYVGDDFNLMPRERSGWFCDAQVPYGSYSWLWVVPDGGDSVYANRFVIPQGQMGCTLTVAYAVVYFEGYSVGNPTMRWYLWEDNGFGLPGTLLDSVDRLIMDPATTSGAWWHGIDFTPASNSTGNWWTFDEGESFLVGWKTVQDPGSGVDDVIATISDDADGPYLGEKRGVMMRDNTWGTMFDFFGAELCQWIDIEYCGWETPPSDCYQKRDAWSAYYCYSTPHYTAGITEWAEQFQATKRETIYSVEVAVNAFMDGAGQSDLSNDLIMTIYDDDGLRSGPGAMRAQETVLGGTYPNYPSTAVFDFYSHGIVYEPGDVYYVSFSTSGTFVAPDDPGNTYEHLVGDDDTNPPGYAWLLDPDDGLWYSYQPSNFHIYVNVCTDAFDVCQYYWTGYNGSSVYSIPDANPILSWAQAIPTQGDECAVRYIETWLYRHSVADAEKPDMFTYNTEINVYNDVGGEPGNLLGQIVLTPQDYADAGYTGSDYFGYLPIRIYDLNIIVPAGQCFIEVYSLSPDPEHGIRLLLARNGEGQYPGGLWCFAPAFGGWLNNPFGDLEPAAADIEAEICCIPYSERDCSENERAGESWATYQHDYARTGASYNSVGEHPECNLNLNWHYEHTSYPSGFLNPIIAGDKVVACFSGGSTGELQYKVLNLSDGSEVYTLTGGLWSNSRSTPTVATIDIEGTPTEVIFVAGNGLTGEVSCHLFSDGTEIWDHDGDGPTQYATFTILNIGGTEIVYWNTNSGNIVAAEAATGILYANWTPNPVNLGYTLANKSGCTDGEYLYFGSYPGGVVEGDIFKVDAATGAFTTFSGGPDGLQSNIIWPEDPQVGEGFLSGLSYEAGVLYANSRIANPDNPGDAVLYAINTADMSLKWAAESARSMHSTPVIDMAKIYIAYYSAWVNPPIGGHAAAFSKETGSLVWTWSPPNADGYYFDFLLTCEPEGYPDHLFVGSVEGIVSCLSSQDGTEIFRRRFDCGPRWNTMVSGGALSATGDIVFQANGAARGLLACLSPDLAKGDRPRLQIQTYNPEMAVEFGSATSLLVETPPLLYNSGCADLTITDITVDLECDDNHVPVFSAMTVRPDVMNRASSIADKLTNSFEAKAPRMAEVMEDEFGSVRSERGVRILNAGATALPPVLNDPPIISPTFPCVIPAGEEITVTFDVNQSLISRGPQYFCIEVESDDDDFYLNPGGAYPNPNDYPSIPVTLAGGCLRQHVQMEFGDDNMMPVYNQGCLTTDDYDHFMINGDDGSFFGGSYIYAITQHRLATGAPDWRGGAEYHQSLQADPNWCDDECTPSLTEDVQVGEISSDGHTYDPVLVSFVCTSFLDSCQNMDDGLGGYGDWRTYDAPFDNDSTMGLYVESRTVGVSVDAKDHHDLDDLTVEIFEVTERNDEEILGWKFAVFVDYDIGSDTADLDRDISTAWTYTAGGAGDVVWGITKIPFGCGDPTGQNYNFEPMKNVMAIDAGQAMFNNLYWDSSYNYMTWPPGAYGHTVTGAADQEFHATITENDFEGLETYEFAVAHFAMHGVTDPTSSAEFAPLVKLANKWCGFGRGDVNNDGEINLADIIYLNNFVNIDPATCPGPIPFMHCGDVDGTPGVDAGDVTFMIDFYFGTGGCPIEGWTF